jgi:erythromycin esterase-like protein
MPRFFVALMLGIGLLTGPDASLAAPARNHLPVHPDDTQALEQVARAICSRQVAVLGEAEHGDARTETFKIALIKQLVAKCGFSAVLFEASFYEFVQLDRLRRSGRVITPDHVATAVGGLWRYDREFQPLLPYLANQTNAGKLRLGGFDFQQGGRGQDYGNFGVVAELAGPLPAPSQEQCRVTFRDMLLKGSNPERRSAAATCLTEIAALPPSGDTDVRRERQEMLANLSAYAAGDPGNASSYIATRDREMDTNFRRWMARWGAGAKVIVWTATAHAARAPHQHKNFAGVKPFGAYLAERYGPRMYALGFTAQGGSTRGLPKPRTIAPPQEGSLEALVGPITTDSAVFLDRAALTRAGGRPAGFFGHLPLAANWSELLDGAVIFPSEQPATDIRQPG